MNAIKARNRKVLIEQILNKVFADQVEPMTFTEIMGKVNMVLAVDRTSDAYMHYYLQNFEKSGWFADRNVKVKRSGNTKIYYK